MRIDTLTHHGLGRAEDGSLVPRTLPGEEAELRDDGTVRIVAPSPDRVTPPCRHFKTCGGCTVQHASDTFVAAWKMGIVSRALAAQDLPDTVAGIETSPANSRRRARFSGRRTKSGATIGFHARASSDVIDTPDCQLVTPGLLARRATAAAFTAAICSRKSELGLTFTEGPAGDDLHLAHDAQLTEAMRHDLTRIAQEQGLARLSYGDEVIVTLDPPVQVFGTGRVVPPPGAFLQATAHGQATLTAAVLRITQGARRVVDLFAGCGTFSLPLATRARVHAVEGDAAMTRALDAGWRATPGLHTLTTEARDLFRRPLLPDELSVFDAAVVDPPRAGARAQIAELAAAHVPTVAMVSCDPATFARDARVLVGAGYAMAPPLVVDQFRWSPHVELVTAFTMT